MKPDVVVYSPQTSPVVKVISLSPGVTFDNCASHDVSRETPDPPNESLRGFLGARGACVGACAVGVRCFSGVHVDIGDFGVFEGTSYWQHGLGASEHRGDGKGEFVGAMNPCVT